MNSRNVFDLKYDWKFSRDKINWEDVRIPHDWAINSEFSKDFDVFEGRILEDGDVVEESHVGRTGGLPHVGKGYYELKIDISRIPGFPVYKLEFDGIMSHSEVFINGHYAGGRPYGYSSFSLDISEFVIENSENTILVTVENPENASRWYPGAGIYRNARLLILPDTHFKYNGIHIIPRLISEDSAVINVEAEIEIENDDYDYYELNFKLYDKEENLLVSTEETEFSVDNILLWEIDNPYLYTLKCDLVLNSEVIDSVSTRIGFREFSFDSENGFIFNGERTKIKGVCMHHDLGALGAAVNVRALERQLEILKSFGCNAIRTSHNPPATELLDLCDTMGFFVMDEIFDEWKSPKVKNGYALDWDKWHRKDLEDLIKRDRNHPSIIMWSIGNEIPDQHNEYGKIIAKELHDICKNLDSTRPTTCGFNQPFDAIENGLTDVVDIVGLNYKPHLYEKFHSEHPDYILLGSETSSCVSSRGIYHFPVKLEVDVLHDDLQVSSYDLNGPPWANMVETEFLKQKELPFMCGEFVWTGFDYLGEPTPYKTQWPSRSSYFGIVDTCGFPKDRYYLYKREWSGEDVLHLYPHWNWEDRIGELTPVICITTYDTAELFVNGKSMGIRKSGEFASDNIDFSVEEGRIWHRAPTIKLKDCIADYRLIWDNVTYEPGSIKVVAYDKNGDYADQVEIVTAGVPSKISLVPDRDEINADGDDLSFITVDILDSNYNFNPVATNLLNFSISGPGEIVGVDNGDSTSTLNLKGKKINAFSGKALVIIRSLKGIPGIIKINCTSDKLESGTVEIVSKF